MDIRVGCTFRYEAEAPTPFTLQVQPRTDGPAVVAYEILQCTPEAPMRSYRDVYGNICRRVQMPPGEIGFTYDARVRVPESYDEVDYRAPQIPIHLLPDEALLHMLPSRYCLSDVLADAAWQMFGNLPSGYARVQAICDWVHQNVRFQYGSSTSRTTAWDVFQSRVGVCRDFAHLGVTFCRALNIPARYVFGYLPDIGVPPPPDPMDFCAWFEAYLGGRWFTFDPRNNEPRVGRVVIGHGRDALDVAMVTTYGTVKLVDLTVWADEIRSNDLVAAGAC